MSLKISQIKDFFFFIQQIRSRGGFLHSSGCEPHFFFFFSFFLTFVMGGATSGQEHSHAYIHCILQRYNKSVCDRTITKATSLSFLTHVQV